MLPGIRVAGGPPVVPTQSQLYLCTLLVGAGYQMERANCGVKVSSGSRAVGKLVGYPMMVDSMEAYVSAIEVNPTC